MRPGRKIGHHHMKAILYKNTVGVQSKSTQTHSIIGLNKVRIESEFYEQSLDLEKKRNSHPYTQ